MPKRKSVDPKLVELRRSGTLYAHADAVRDPRFGQNPFFDPRDALQVKYEMLRSVTSDGVSVSAAARLFGLSRPAFYEAQHAFQKAGLAGLIRERPGPRRSHKLSENVMKFVAGAREATPPPSLAEIVRSIKMRFGVSVHRRSLERAIARRTKKAR